MDRSRARTEAFVTPKEVNSSAIASRGFRAIFAKRPLSNPVNPILVKMAANVTRKVRLSFAIVPKILMGTPAKR